MTIAITLLALIAGYLAIGLLVAVPFVAVGAARRDEAARGASLGFRMLILPGAAALWPLIAWRWLRRLHPHGDPTPLLRWHRVIWAIMPVVVAAGLALAWSARPRLTLPAVAPQPAESPAPSDRRLP